MHGDHKRSERPWWPGEPPPELPGHRANETVFHKCAWRWARRIESLEFQPARSLEQRNTATLLLTSSVRGAGDETLSHAKQSPQGPTRQETAMLPQCHLIICGFQIS